MKEGKFEGIIPYEEIDGSTNLLIGRFIDFLNDLINTNKSLKQAKTLQEWQVFLINLINVFFVSNKNTNDELEKLREIANNLKSHSYFKEKIDTDTILAYIKDKLKDTIKKSFSNHGILFSSILQSRSLPYKIICLLGMDQESFPRNDKQYNFNLMLKNPQKGDKNSAKDDASLFLEALLCAREKFFISYIGSDIKDNSKKPPSVFVIELLDYIKNNFENIEDITRHHKLQAFSPVYFNGDNKMLFSYSKDNQEIAQKLITSHKKTRKLFSSLDKKEKLNAEFKEISIRDFCLFFKNPIAYFMKKNLNIYLQENDDLLEEKESFEVEKGLDEYKIKKDALGFVLDKKIFNDFYETKKGQGVLPHMHYGKVFALQIFNESTNFAKKIKSLISYNEKKCDINLCINEIKISGIIGNIFNNNLILHKQGELKAKDTLNLWILHIILKQSQKNIQNSFFITPKKTVIFSKIENPKEILKKLIKKYINGINSPLHFFPETSFKYIQAIKNGKNNEAAIITAKKSWLTSKHFANSENQNPYYKTYFLNDNNMPFDKTFEKNAKDILTNLFSHISSSK